MSILINFFVKKILYELKIVFVQINNEIVKNGSTQFPLYFVNFEFPPNWTLWVLLPCCIISIKTKGKWYGKMAISQRLIDICTRLNVRLKAYHLSSLPTHFESHLANNSLEFYRRWYFRYGFDPGDNLGYSRYAFVPREVSGNGCSYRVYVNIFFYWCIVRSWFFY